MVKKPAAKQGAAAADQASLPASPKVKKTATKKAAPGLKPPKAAEAAAAAAAAEAGAAKGKEAAARGGGTSGAEIDDLFGALKGKKSSKAEGATAAPASPTKGGKGAGKSGAQQGPAKVLGSKDDIFGTEAAAGRKRTEEGYAIYSENELGLGKSGGDTDKCPFDCDCCF